MYVRHEKNKTEQAKNNGFMQKNFARFSAPLNRAKSSFCKTLVLDLISDCCYEDYKDRKRENQERVVEETLDAPEKSKQKMSLQETLWNSFENPQVSSVALVFYYVTGFFIAVSVLSNIIETIPCQYLGDNETVTCGELYERQFFVLDTACVIIFSVEYLLRLFAAPDRCKFVR